MPAVMDNEAAVAEELTEFLSARLLRAAKYVAGYIKLQISTQGSITPLVVSGPWEYPFRQTGELQQSIKSGEGDHPLQAVVVSDAVDQHLHPGHHYSAEVEFGHWWDGWAWDWKTGRILQVSRPHVVQPRPYMRRGLRECHEAIFDIVSGTGVQS